MKRFKNILLVADFDMQQQAAVDRAVALARQNRARLTVVSVVREVPPDMQMAITIVTPGEVFDMVMEDRAEIVDALVTKIGQQGVDAESKVVAGVPFVETIRAVLRDKHDLVILAADGKGGIKERLFGSTSMHLMRKCPCPVWVVKPTPHPEYRRILAAVDTTSDILDSDRESLNPLILQLSSSLARMDKSRFQVVQVWSVFGERHMQVRGQIPEDTIAELRKETKRELAKKLDGLLAALDLQGIHVDTHMPMSKNPAQAIVKLASDEDIELLVMGTVCRTGIAGFFIGNTAEKVLSEVNCSVLTVKPQGFVTPVTLANA